MGGNKGKQTLADFVYLTRIPLNFILFKDVRVHAQITRIKLGIPTYFMDHSEFITGQCRKILSGANKNEIECFEFGSIKRALRPHLRTIIAG